MQVPLRGRLRLLAAFMLTPWYARAQSSGGSTSSSVAPSQGVPAQGAATQGAATQGTATQGATAQGTATQGTATQGTTAATATRYEAGKIDLVAGSVTVTAPDRSSRVPRQGESIYEGDAVTTGRDGELHVTMMDAGVIAVRPNTQMSITRYLAEGGTEDTSVFSLLKGSFRSITGWIGKNNPARYSINTPTATIGVRGTDHEPMVIPEGSADGEPGTYDKVSAGGSFIRGQRGSVDVTPGRAGFFSQRGTAAPRLLDRVPTFFRPTRNEARLNGMHDRIRASLDQRRTERQQFVRQRQQQIQQQRQQGQQPGRQQPGQQLNQQQRQQQRQERQEQRQERQGQQQRNGANANGANANGVNANGQRGTAQAAEHRQELQQERRAQVQQQAQQRVQQAQEHRQANAQAPHNAQAAAQSHAAEERRKRLEEEREKRQQHHR